MNQQNMTVFATAPDDDASTFSTENYLSSHSSWSTIDTAQTTVKRPRSTTTTSNSFASFLSLPRSSEDYGDDSYRVDDERVQSISSSGRTEASTTTTTTVTSPSPLSSSLVPSELLLDSSSPAAASSTTSGWLFATQPSYSTGASSSSAAFLSSVATFPATAGSTSAPLLVANSAAAVLAYNSSSAAYALDGGSGMTTTENASFALDAGEELMGNGDWMDVAAICFKGFIFCTIIIGAVLGNALVIISVRRNRKLR